MRLAVLINLALSIGLPLGLAFLLIVKDIKLGKLLLLGMLCFLVFQVFTRIPLIQLVLVNQVWFIVFSYKYPLLFIFVLSLSAGVFEELGRYIIMRKWLNKGRIMEILAFGIGHGGIEAILLVGLGVLMSDVSAVDNLNLIMGGLERVFAMCMHVAFSFMVHAQVAKQHKYSLALAILAHTAVNFIAVYLMSLGVGILYVEFVLFIMAMLAVFYVLRERKRFYENQVIIV